MNGLPSLSAALPAKYFYFFLGAHSLLIGLLPFYLPVYLWGHGLQLAGLCLLIAASGFSFILALTLWQYCAAHWRLNSLVAMSFALEVGLLVVVALFMHSALNATLVAAACIGIANGFYNAFFWTTQRSLFSQQLGNNDAGRQFGNFQIFVTIVLKVGILVGGVLLDHGNLMWLLLLSALVSLASYLILATGSSGRSTLYSSQSQSQSQSQSHPTPNPAPSLSIAECLRFRDRRGSQTVFAIDGIFLYLESHFWTLSLFLFVREDYARLGVIVVLLAVLFAILFYIIKNRIDAIAIATVYKLAVLLYGLSWLLRYMLGDDMTQQAANPQLLLILLLITFCSSFFRLAFNKRFFDIVQRREGISYLIVKSYISQLWLGVFFTLVTITLLISDTPDALALQWLYLPAAAMTLVYLIYRRDTLVENTNGHP